MKENGSKIIVMVKESTLVPMEQNTTANGLMTCKMAKERKLGLKAQNSMVSTNAVKRMDLVHITRKEPNTLVNGSITSSKVSACTISQTAAHIMVSGKTMRCMVLASMITAMECDMKDSTSMIENRDSAYFM